ncbi:MAG TPA: hypothetical protein VFF21_05960 [Flavobacteriaceae bacterium]|nr:hypothetical protein [Flavobacteriaceae bacterium]
MLTLFYNLFLLIVQPGKTPPPPNPPNVPNAPGLPIDSDLWILFIAGILIGGYILYTRIRSISKAS